MVFPTKTLTTHQEHSSASDSVMLEKCIVDGRKDAVEDVKVFIKCLISKLLEMRLLQRVAVDHKIMEASIVRCHLVKTKAQA